MSAYALELSIKCEVIKFSGIVWQVQVALRRIEYMLERRRKARIDAAFLACLQRDADERIARWRALYRRFLSAIGIAKVEA